jgi:hypothetical protein
MLAILGHLITTAGNRLPGDIAYGVPFSSVKSGLAAFDGIPAAGSLQLVNTLPPVPPYHCHSRLFDLLPSLLLCPFLLSVLPIFDVTPTSFIFYMIPTPLYSPSTLFHSSSTIASFN